MSFVQKSRILGLTIFVFSLISINVILILSQSFDFKSNPTPGNYYKNFKVYNAGDALRDKQDISSYGYAIPYIDGTTSISRLGRVTPNNYIFKPLMIISGILMCMFWYYQRKILDKLIPEKNNNKIFYLGVITGICLIIHISLLGVKIDNNIYKIFVRLVLALSVICGVLTKLHYVKTIKILKEKNIFFKNVLFSFQYYLVYIVIFLIFACIPLLLIENAKQLVLIIEWNTFVIIFLFYFIYYFSWNNYSVIQPPPSTL